MASSRLAVYPPILGLRGSLLGLPSNRARRAPRAGAHRADRGPRRGDRRRPLHRGDLSDVEFAIPQLVAQAAQPAALAQGDAQPEDGQWRGNSHACGEAKAPFLGIGVGGFEINL
jgi:hypothetical protein